jgi:predicted TPR repeat methyltransferase
MNVFDEYANYYDLLYTEKDYAAECDFIETLFSRFQTASVRKILDLGCGTGGHAIPLAERGYSLLGVDRSEKMLEKALKKATESAADVEFLRSDIRDLSIDQQFDAVLAMFAVMSYQTENDDLLSVFHTARRYLKPGGLFIFDSWFGPAVLHLRPSDRETTITLDDQQVQRSAHPTLDVTRNTVRVDYRLTHSEKDEEQEIISESHLMRFLFVPEINLMCSLTGFSLLKVCPFMELDRLPDERDWNVSWITQAV